MRCLDECLVCLLISIGREGGKQWLFFTYLYTLQNNDTETLRALEEAVRRPGPLLEAADASVQGQVKEELRGMYVPGWSGVGWCGLVGGACLDVWSSSS